jgi:hypothetical protein
MVARFARKLAPSPCYTEGRYTPPSRAGSLRASAARVRHCQNWPNGLTFSASTLTDEMPANLILLLRSGWLTFRPAERETMVTPDSGEGRRSPSLTVALRLVMASSVRPKL